MYLYNRNPISVTEEKLEFWTRHAICTMKIYHAVLVFSLDVITSNNGESLF